MMHYNDRDKLDTNKDLHNFKYFNTCNITEKWTNLYELFTKVCEGWTNYHQ